jgi:GT2 family glycosyltransferase
VAAAEGDPAIVAVGPQLLDAAGRALPANAVTAWAATRGEPLPSKELPCIGLAGEGLLLRAEAFREVGGFDVAFRDRLADLDPGLVALMALSSRAFALD